MDFFSGEKYNYYFLWGCPYGSGWSLSRKLSGLLCRRNTAPRRFYPSPIAARRTTRQLQTWRIESVLVGHSFKN